MAGAGSDWKDQLAPPPDEDEFAMVGLLFQLRTLTRTGAQWTAPQAKPADAVRARGRQRLAVRPALRSSAGNWTTGQVTWSSLKHKHERLHLDRRHVNWFGQFVALHRNRTEGFRATEPDWLYLDDFASPLLWPLLAEGAALGIPFVTGKRATDVRIADAAEVHLELVRDGGTESLRLTPEVRIDGEPILPTGTVGDHGLYRCEFHGGLQVLLAPVTAEATDVLRWEQPFLRIPGEDVDEFLKHYLPDLAARVPVTGRGVKVPEVTTATVLQVHFGDDDALTTRWGTRTGTRWTPLPDPPELDLPIPVRPRWEGAEAAAFVTESIPLIEAAGIIVERHGEDPGYVHRRDDPTLRFSAVPREGDNDWFDLGFVVLIGPYTVALKDIFTALSRGRDKLLMVDKSWLSLHHPVFDALRELIEEGTQLREWETGAIVPRARADLFEPFEDTADQTPEARQWRRAAQALTQPPAPIDPPPLLQADLRPYQLEGFRWLAHLWDHGLGGVLADDMGLGKTVQTIALLVHAEGTGSPFLVVAPTSVVGGWADEIARFAPHLRVAVIASTKDEIPADTDVVITSYAILRLEADRLVARTWAGVVLDEAQYVKNPGSQVHEVARQLDARMTIALTGTPLENSLTDVWAIFRIVAPGLFASRITFANRFIKAHSAERIDELRRRIRPLLLRRTKANVASELPAKSEQIVHVDLDPAHRALYDRYLQRERQKLLDLVQDLDRNRFIVFRSLTLLRLLALDPRLIPTDEEQGPQEIPSAKLDELIDRISDLAAEGHRALVFSQFTGYLALVRERLTAAGIDHEYLDGATRRRASVIDDFRTGDAPVFLISLRAGGVGLTITEADYVFLLDPWWNPAAEAQAIDRTHRIGQTRPVMVYRLVARDTIEEKVLALGERKRRLFDEVIDGGDLFAGELTASDIRGLLD